MSCTQTSELPQMTLKQALGTPPKMVAAGAWIFLMFAMAPLMVSVAARAAIVAGSDEGGIWQAVTSGVVFQDPMLLMLVVASVIGECLFIGLPFYLGKDVVSLLKQKFSRKKKTKK